MIGSPRSLAAAGRRLLLLASVLLALSACNAASRPAPPAPITLTVLAAASLQDAFNEMGRSFSAAQPGVRVAFTFAGSQELAQQLAQGAPADLFASANDTQMQAAIAGGRVAEGASRPFLHNRLVIVMPADNPGAIEQPVDLARPGLRLVLADATVPAGRYSREFLAAASADPSYGPDYEAAVLANVLSFEQNVRAALSKVTLGEADAAIVYSSDALSAGDKVAQVPLPDALSPLATYPIAPISDSAHPDEAAAFMAFVLSAPGQAILQKHGFQPVE